MGRPNAFANGATDWQARTYVLETIRSILLSASAPASAYLEERGVRVSAFEVRLPKHESERANTDERNDCPKKSRWNGERPHF